MEENHCEKTGGKRQEVVDRLTELIGQEVVVEITSQHWGGGLNDEDSKPKVREVRGILEAIGPSLYNLKLRGMSAITGFTSSRTGAPNATAGGQTEITKISYGDEVVFNNPFQLRG